MTRYAAFVEKTRAALLGPGELEPALRAALIGGDEEALPPALRAWAGKVRTKAWEIADDDVESLKRAGFSEDQIFEATAAAALGAALHRLEIGMTALRGGSE